MFSYTYLLLLLCVLTAAHGQNSLPAKQCDVPQGMASGDIPDTALVVSSTAGGYRKGQARYGCCQEDCGAAWCPATDDQSPYFEVHLENLTTVASINFQHPTSCNGTFADTYMKTFRLLYIPAIGSDEFLEFNHEIDSIYNESVSYRVGFKPHFVTKAIRIEPQTHEKAACFKFEIYGCEPAGLCQKDFCKNGGTCVGKDLCGCKGAYYGEQCQHEESELYILVTKFIFLRIENNILRTTSFNMTVSGSVTLETVGTQSLIRLGDGGTATVHPESGHLPPCLDSLDTCHSGLTYSLTVNIEKMTSQRLDLMSSGNEALHNGLWLYYEGKTLSCHVSTSSEVWVIDVISPLSLSKWYTIEISWNRILGLQLLLNNKTVGSFTRPAERQPGHFQRGQLGIGSSSNIGTVMRIYQLQVIPLVRSEVIRARLTNDTSPPTLPREPTRPGECNAALGMETDTIRSDQLSASASAAGHHKDDARYGPKEGVAGTSWCPKINTMSFYEVHMDKPSAIAAIRFQHPMTNTTYYPEYMKTFRLLFRDVHSDDREMSEFSQNVPAIYNQTTAMTIYLSPRIVTDVIRFEPQTWESKACFRFELLGCDPKDLCDADFCRNGGSCIGENVCTCPEGYFGSNCDATTVTVIKYIFLRVERNIVVTTTTNLTTHGTVTFDHSLITLSNHGYLEMPLYAECLSHLDTCTSGFTFTLNLKFTTHLTTEKVYLVSSGGDVDGVKGISLYFQDKAFHCYVTTSSRRWLLEVPYSLVTSQWYRFRVSWSPSRGLTLLEGNSVIGTSFSTAGVEIHATKTRPLKIGYTHESKVTLVIQEITTAEQVFGEIQRAGVTDSPLPTTAETNTVTTTHSTPTNLCDSRLGMSDKTITDDQLTVSTSSPGHGKEQLRYGCCTDEDIGGWCSSDTDSHQWVQVKLKDPMAISRILFQHPAQRNKTVTPTQYVKVVRMLYNNPLRDDSQLELYSQYIPVTHNATVSYSVTLQPVVVTDTVQFMVTDYVGRPCMRLELVGCNPEVLCQPDICHNGGSCIGKNACKCKDNFYGIQCQLKKSDIPNNNYKIIEKIKNIITTTHLNLTINSMVGVNTQQSETFLVLSNQGYVEIPQTDPCVQDLDQCNTGFTYSININLRNVTKEMPILATGNGATGVYMLYTNGSFVCSVGSSEGMWTISVRHHLTLETWYQIDLSWSSFRGLHLHVDGVDIGGTVASAGKSHTFAKHLLWIGNGNTAVPTTGSFIYWIKQIRIFFSIRQDLVRAGLLEDKNTTPTPVIPPATTTNRELSSCNSFTDITFARINGTDLLTSLITMKVYGDACLEQSKGGTLLVLDGPGQYIDMQKTGIPCLDDITTCSTSFNFRLTFQFIKIDMHPNYILSSGGEAVNSSGVALYYKNGKLLFWVKNGKSVGKSIFSVNMKNGTWYTLDASWDKTSEETSVHLNGRALKNTPLRTTNAPETRMTHSLLIGKSWDKNFTSHIKLLLFRIWTESLKELAENNCTEELSMPDVTPTTGRVSGPTTPKATSVTTTVETSPPDHHQFIFTSVIGNILVTTDYNLTLHGNVSLMEGQQDKGNAISITGPKQWIEMNVENVACLSDMNTCYNGITVHVEMMIVEMKKTATIYLLRAGNSHATSPLLLYYQGTQLHATIHVGKTLWSVSTSYSITTKQSHAYQLVWSRQKGIQLVVDGVVLKESVTSTQTNATATTLQALMMGEVENVTSMHLEISQIEVWNERKETDTKQTSLKQTATERTPSRSSLTTLDTGRVSGPTTPKATSVTTTVETSPPDHHQFIFTSVIGNILVTTDYNLTLHGNVSLMEGQQDKGNAISITGPKQWIEMNVENVACLSDMNTCYNGITVHVEMMIVEMKKTATIYLLRVGNSHATSPLLLYYQGTQLHATIHVGKTLWSVSTSYSITTKQSHAYQLVWSRQKGIQLVVDGVVVKESVTSTQTNATATTLQALMMGEVENVTSMHLEISQIEVWNERKETYNKQTSVKQTATERTPSRSSLTTLDTGQVSGPTTPKATSVTTTVETSPPDHHQFIFTSVIGNILVTTDYNLTLHGNVSLMEGQQDKGNVISITGPKQWIEMNVENVACLSDMNTCYNGITVHVEMMIVEMKKTATIYLLRAGNCHATSPLLLYYQGTQLHATIHVGKTLWSVSTSYSITTKQSHAYQLVWSRQKGIQLVVDGVVLKESVTSTQTNATATTLQALMMGEVENVTSMHLEISQIEVWNERKETDNKQTSLKQTATERTPSRSSLTTLDTGQVSGPTTPKATSVTTTVETSPPDHHQFIFTSVIGNILVTTDYNLTLHGNVSLMEGQQDKGNVISITGPKQWIEMNVENVACLSDMNTCYNGITAQVEMMIVEMKKTATIYLLRAGNRHATSPLLLYYQGTQLHATIHVGKTLWSVSTSYSITTKQSHAYQLVWSRQKGIQLVVDGVVVKESVTSTQTNATATTLQALMMGEVENVTSMHLEISQIEVWNERKETDNKQTSLKQYHTATTSQSTPKMETNITSNDLSFTGIFGKVITTKSFNMTVNGNASLLNHDNLTYLHLNGRKQWLDIPEEIVPCASEPKDCISGFTFQISIQVKMILPQNQTNFISSGNGNRSFIFISYMEDILFAIVTRGHKKWVMSTKYTISMDKFDTYQISWSNADGARLYVNNVLLAVQQIPVTVSPNITTTVPASDIRIGGSQGRFLVTNIHSWTTTRTVLAERGILPIPIETCNGKPVSWNNMTIDMSFLSVTGDRLMTRDMVIIAHGNPTIIKANDKLYLDISHPGQYVEIETRCLPCFSDLVHCTTGFTVQLVTTFTHIATSGRMYIVYNGQETPGYTEVYLFYERGHFKGVVASGQHKWPINIAYKLEANIPYTFHISWSQSSGYQLYVNEQVTQPTQSLPPFVTATKVPSTFLIGKAANVDKTTSMIITDFKLFNATKMELVKMGILKPALTTISTTTMFPPTSPDLPEFIWKFENVTSKNLNSSYLQVIIHGGVESRSSGLVFTADKQYLEIQNLAKSCLTDITKCRHGLTISVEMVFTKLNENTVVFTTGGEAPDLPGVSMLYRYGHFHVIVSSGVKAWFVSIPRDHIKLGTTHVIYIYFKEALKVYINRELVASTLTYVSHPDTSGEMKNVFYFGKSFTTATTGHHLQCILKAIHIWYQGIDLTSQLTSTPAVTSSLGVCPVGCISLASTARPETTALKMTFPSTTHPPATTAVTTTTQPQTTQNIGIPPFNVDLTVTPVVDVTGTYLACRLSTYTTRNVLIQFQWTIDGMPQLIKEVQTPVTEGRLYITEVNNVRDNLYDKEIICKAKGKFTTGWQWTQFIISQTPFIPTITSLTSTTAHLTVTEGQQARQIELKSNCPPQLFCKFTDKGKCKVELVVSLVKHPLDLLCTREAILPQIVIQSSGNTTDVCGKGMTSSNWKNIIQIPMKATVDGLYDHDQTREILVKLKTTGAFKESMYKTIAKYTVKAKDSDKSSQCASLNDPHITTFDGLHYNNFQRGEFVLYKHKTLPYEVRTNYRVCSSRNSRGPTCNCAVAIKSGDDVITFTGCHGSTRQTFYGRFFHQTTSITVEMYKNGELTPGTTVRRIGCGQKYEVRLPTGTIVTVQSSYLSFINIWVRPSAVDYRQSEGLCGSFTGSKNDDLYGADHKTYRVQHTPDEFSKTWQVSERNTMFHGVAAEKTTTETYCNCVEGRQLYCAPRLDIFRCTSTSYKDDITATLVLQAKLPSTAIRRFKREAHMQADPLEEDTGVSTYNEQSARSYCENYINNQPAKQACVDYVTLSDDLLKDCAQDLMDTGDKDWAQSHLDDIVTKCISEAERNVSMWNGADNATIWENIPKDIMDKLCPDRCVHGNCSEGSCVCQEGYTGLNCSISKDVRPGILPVNEDGGGCNVNHMDCSQITIMGLNFVNSDTLDCFYQPVKVTSHVAESDQWIPALATFLSMYQVVCSLPSPPQSARVAVSNNGQQRSSQSYLHVVHDDCHTCEVNEKGTDASCIRKAATCLINGDCYQYGDRKPEDRCQLCEPHVNSENWTMNTDPICTATKLSAPSQTANGVNASTIALAVVVAVCAVVIIAGAVAICRKRGTAQRKKVAEEGDYNSPQSGLSSRPHPNLRNISFGNLTYDGSAASLASPEMQEIN